MEILHAEVDRVRDEVASIHKKLDVLVNNSSKNTTARENHYTPAPGERPTLHGLPHPAQLRAAANVDGYVDRMYNQAQYAPPRSEGKKLYNDNGDNPMRKPYMYIVRETCQTNKQKLEVRCTLPPLEYINAMVALLRDPQAYDSRDLTHIMQHLQDLTHDVAEGAWPAVRRRSQHVWDMVEEGRIAWADYQEIQNLRLRMAYATGPAGNNTAAPATGIVEVICRQHNMKQGCRHRGHHTEGNIKFLHNCAFCDAEHRTCRHSVFDCGNTPHGVSTLSVRDTRGQQRQTGGANKMCSITSCPWHNPSPIRCQKTGIRRPAPSTRNRDGGAVSHSKHRHAHHV